MNVRDNGFNLKKCETYGEKKRDIGKRENICHHCMDLHLFIFELLNVYVTFTSHIFCQLHGEAAAAPAGLTSSVMYWPAVQSISRVIIWSSFNPWRISDWKNRKYIKSVEAFSKRAWADETQVSTQNFSESEKTETLMWPSCLCSITRSWWQLYLPEHYFSPP